MEESPYQAGKTISIKPIKVARTELITILMQPWLRKERIRGRELEDDLRVIDLNRKDRMVIEEYIDDYKFLGGNLIWRVEDVPILQQCLKAILQLSEGQFISIVAKGDAELLRNYVRKKTNGFSDDDVDEICNILTKVNEDAEYGN